MSQQTPSVGAVIPDGSSSLASRARELLARYDRLGEADIAELVGIHRQLTPVELAFFESDEFASAPLARFRREHRSKTRTPVRHYAGLFAVLALSLAAILLGLAYHS